MYGPIRSETTAQQAQDFINFKNTGNFRVEMLIYDKNLNLVRTINNLLTQYPSISGGTYASINFSTLEYSFVISNGFTISNLGKGYSILFRLNPD